MRKEQGGILITTMILLGSMVALALAYSQIRRQELQTSHAFSQGLKNDSAIDGYLEYLKAYQASESSTKTIETERFELGESYIYILGRDMNSTQGASETVYQLIDESSKLNLNSATQEMLEKLPRMTPELAAAIIDWRDEDDEVSPGGAESTAYALKDPGYSAKNAPFESVEELLRVEGFDEALVFGEDWNQNGQLDPNENDGDQTLPEDNSDGVLNPGLIEYVTAYTHNDLSASGNMTGITPSDPQSLRTALEGRLSSQRINSILNQVGQTPYTNLLQLYLLSGMTRSEYDQVYQHIYINTPQGLSAKINPARAPREVLLCLPNLEEADVDKIITYRQDQSEQVQSLAWVVEAIGREKSLGLGDHISDLSFQFRADIHALSQWGKNYRRLSAVFDTAQSPSRISHRIPMQRYGYALPFSSQEMIQNEKGLFE